MKYDIRLLTLAADTLLRTNTNPLHRRILENHRRHAMLEVSGRYHEIFLAEMAVESPFYRLASPEGMVDLDDINAVKGFYQGLIDSGTTVMLLEHEHIVVSDWGLASEALYNTLMTGETAIASGHQVDDPNGKYIDSRWVCMMWPYDDKGRMIGEYVYPAPGATVRQIPENEFVTMDEARSIFEPLIADSQLTEVA